MSFFFFFQAEDGIRDYKVTGVQTCALPICGHAFGGSLAPIEPAVVAAAQYLVAARSDAGQANGGGDRLRARLEKAHSFEPRNFLAERLGELFLGDGRQWTDDTRGDRRFRRAIDVSMAVSQRHRAQRHDEVDVLPAVFIPDAAAGRPCHARGRAEERVGTLATGRREARNAPVVHRIWSPR